MIDLTDIENAQEKLTGVIHHTRLEPSRTFSELADCSIHLKTENLQRTGSFKIRGAFNFMRSLPAASAACGVVAASAGNHAQGVALAAQEAGMQATVVMPRGTPISKIAATRSYGAEVLLHGTVFDDAFERALQIQQETGAALVHAFDHPQIIAGQGTVGLEILRDLPQVSTVLVPIGGGGLISGTALAIKEQSPQVKIIGVEAEGAASARASLNAGQIVSLAQVRTIADGISVKRPGELTYEIMSRYVDDVVTVTDDEIASTVLLLLERAKLVVEGAGAAALAAAVYHPGSLRGEKVVAVLSGGNIDVNFVSRIIEQGLIKTGRRISLTTVLPDRPGNLQQFLAVVAENGANVISIYHDRLDANTPLDEVQVNVVLETHSTEHACMVASALQEAGYTVDAGHEVHQGG